MQRFLYLLVFILCSYTVTAQDIGMISEKSAWHFFLGFAHDDNRYMCDSGNDFTFEGTEELNGKTYSKLFMDVIHLDGGGSFMKSKYAYSSDVENAYVIGMREEGGRVYVDKAEYMSFIDTCSWHFPECDTEYIPYEETDDGELVLYDFTMKEGDRFRSVPGYADLYVVSVRDTCLSDGVDRKMLTLSNGMILIEGIGCVNSPGMLIAYLNYRVPEEYMRYGVLFTSFIYEIQDMEGYVYYKEKEDAARDALGMANVTADRLRRSDQTLYDLSGKRLTAKPQSGLYIQDGKKLIIPKER